MNEEQYRVVLGNLLSRLRYSQLTPIYKKLSTDSLTEHIKTVNLLIEWLNILITARENIPNSNDIPIGRSIKFQDELSPINIIIEDIYQHIVILKYIFLKKYWRDPTNTIMCKYRHKVKPYSIFKDESIYKNKWDPTRVSIDTLDVKIQSMVDYLSALDEDDMFLKHILTNNINNFQSVLKYYQVKVKDK